MAHCLLVYLLLPSQHCVPHSVAMGEKAPRFAWGSALRLSSWNHPPDWMRKDWAGNDFFPLDLFRSSMLTRLDGFPT